MDRPNPPETFTTCRRVAVWALAAGAGILAALPATALAGSRVPHSNLVRNPSFAHGSRDWSGFKSKLRPVKVPSAPDGSRAIEVIGRSSTSYTIDGLPAAVGGKGHAPSREGARYRAGAWVAAARRSHRARVRLVVRETTPSGEYVDGRSRALTATRRFRLVRTTYRAQSSGDQIDVYLQRGPGHLRRHDSFLADAVSLVRQGSKTSGGGTTGAPTGGGGGTGGGSTLTTSTIAVTRDDELELLAERGTRYRYIIVRDSLRAELPVLRQLHPEAKILVYKNLSFTNYDPTCLWVPFQGAGVSWCDARGHESWFLHDSHGNRLESDYNEMYAMNLANPGYQQAWYDSVHSRLTDALENASGVGYDGVWMDDTNVYPGHGLDGRIAEQSDAQYRQATVDFISNVGQRLKDEGYIVMPNLGIDPTNAAQRSAAVDIAHHVSVINQEGYVRWYDSSTGQGPLFTTPAGTSGQDWTVEQQMMDAIQGAGAGFRAQVYGSKDEIDVQRYARATFLMGWDGRSASAIAFRTADGTQQTYLPDWTVDVGTPAEGRRQVGYGWMRHYSGGVVVIDTSNSASQKFSLGGRYRSPTGSCVRSAALKATTALILPSC